MDRAAKIGSFFLLFFVVGYRLASAAEIDSPPLSEVRSDFFAGAGLWMGKSDTEAKSTLDKKGRQDGYEIQSDWELSRLFFHESFGPLAAFTWRRFDRQNLDYSAQLVSSLAKKKSSPLLITEFDSRNYIDDAGIGTRSFFHFLESKWQFDFLYHRVWNEEDSTKYNYDGFLTTDLKTKFSLARRTKLKIRHKFMEYLRTKSGDAVDTFQSKLEVTPSFNIRNFYFGLQNRLTHKFKLGGSRSAIDTAPFVKFENKLLEVTVRAIYLPFVSNDGRFWADGWLSRPVYSAEVQFNL